MVKAGSTRGKKKVGSSSSNRASILNEALLAFARQGFDGVSFAGIAREVGVAQALLHYHFGDKEQLWREAMELAYADFEPRFLDVDAEMSDLSGLQRAQALTRRFVYFVAAHPELVSLWMHELQNDTPRLDWLVERFLGPLTRVFNRALSDAQHKGQIKPLPLEHLAAIFIGSAAIFLAARPAVEVLAGVDALDPDTVRRHADVVVEVLFAGMQTYAES